MHISKNGRKEYTKHDITITQWRDVEIPSHTKKIIFECEFVFHIILKVR